MCKLKIIIVLMFILCLLTACTQAETNAEDTYNSMDTSQSSLNNEVIAIQDIPEKAFTGGAGNDVLAASAGTTITQTIECADGRTISIDAETASAG